VTLTSGTKTLGTTTANASGIWSFTPSGLANGSQTVVATETNSAGETGSASLTFILDTIAPTVTSDAVSGTKVSAGAGTLTAGASVALTLALSEAVNLSGGAPTLTLNDGGTATYDAAHSTSKSLVFDYTVAAGQYATALAVTGINLHGATVTDVAGNAANFAGASATFAHILVDGTTPVATADHAHDTQGGTVSVAHAQAATAGVLANVAESDPADVLTVSAVNGSATSVGHAVAGAYGTLTLSSDGSYAYTNSNAAAVTAAGGVAADFFNYTVSNGHGGTANSALTVLITGPTESYLAGAHGGTIKAGNGSYVLDGSAGNVNATAGNIGTQWLVGGAGDTMNGGNSTDTFLFAPSFGKETINNFNTAHDVIDLPQSLFANFAAVQADMHASGANTVIALEANDAITLSGIAVQNLHAQNFHFIV
jgi:VCBS repeat-containing protein